MGKDFLFKKGQKVLFIGDSITDCERRGNFAPFGNGYVKVAIDLITAKYPERNITYLNKGLGGNTVEDLFNRWTDDVLVHNPDWISVKIGINDLHRVLRNIGGSVTEGNGKTISPERFADFYYKILDISRKKTKAKIILIDPFYMSVDDKSNSFRSDVLKLIPKYLKVVHKMANLFDAISVQTHEVFQKQLKYRNADFFGLEPVHPYLNGHIIIAHELLKKLQW